ncbi:Hypothetical protein, putative [Bodo saltans]|uniref:PH domain-containing protein n=1 Tax=Bodo saltans TaxID=75058 RepID=A0A0S4IP68_BODSA|nr:Hypothetical protein, putative [Bodo saltans]|eukprot:CUF02104.1 Hypothetical protein, putative [Bodo saltans]
MSSNRTGRSFSQNSPSSSSSTRAAAISNSAATPFHNKGGVSVSPPPAAIESHRKPSTTSFLQQPIEDFVLFPWDPRQEHQRSFSIAIAPLPLKSVHRSTTPTPLTSGRSEFVATGLRDLKLRLEHCVSHKDVDLLLERRNEDDPTFKLIDEGQVKALQSWKESSLPPPPPAVLELLQSSAADALHLVIEPHPKEEVETSAVTQQPLSLLSGLEKLALAQDSPLLPNASASAAALSSGHEPLASSVQHNSDADPIETIDTEPKTSRGSAPRTMATTTPSAAAAATTSSTPSPRSRKTSFVRDASEASSPPSSTTAVKLMQRKPSGSISSPRHSSVSPPHHHNEKTVASTTAPQSLPASIVIAKAAIPTSSSALTVVADTTTTIATTASGGAAATSALLQGFASARPSALTVLLIFHQFESNARRELLVDESSSRLELHSSYHHQMTVADRRQREQAVLRLERQLALREAEIRAFSASQARTLVETEVAARSVLEQQRLSHSTQLVREWGAEVRMAQDRLERTRLASLLEAREGEGRREILHERNLVHLELVAQWWVCMQPHGNNVNVQFPTTSSVGRTSPCGKDEAAAHLSLIAAARSLQFENNNSSSTVLHREEPEGGYHALFFFERTRLASLLEAREGEGRRDIVHERNMAHLKLVAQWWVSMQPHVKHVNVQLPTTNSVGRTSPVGKDEAAAHLSLIAAARSLQFENNPLSTILSHHREGPEGGYHAQESAFVDEIFLSVGAQLAKRRRDLHQRNEASSAADENDDEATMLASPYLQRRPQDNNADDEDVDDDQDEDEGLDNAHQEPMGDIATLQQPSISDEDDDDIVVHAASGPRLSSLDALLATVLAKKHGGSAHTVSDSRSGAAATAVSSPRGDLPPTDIIVHSTGQRISTQHHSPAVSKNTNGGDAAWEPSPPSQRRRETIPPTHPQQYQQQHQHNDDSEDVLDTSETLWAPTAASSQQAAAAPSIHTPSSSVVRHSPRPQVSAAASPPRDHTKQRATTETARETSVVLLQRDAVDASYHPHSIIDREDGIPLVDSKEGASVSVVTEAAHLMIVSSTIATSNNRGSVSTTTPTETKHVSPSVAAAAAAKAQSVEPKSAAKTPPLPHYMTPTAVKGGGVAASTQKTTGHRKSSQPSSPPKASMPSTATASAVRDTEDYLSEPPAVASRSTSHPQVSSSVRKSAASSPKAKPLVTTNTSTYQKSLTQDASLASPPAPRAQPQASPNHHASPSLQTNPQRTVVHPPQKLSGTMRIPQVNTVSNPNRSGSTAVDSAKTAHAYYSGVTTLLAPTTISKMAEGGENNTTIQSKKTSAAKQHSLPLASFLRSSSAPVPTAANDDIIGSEEDLLDLSTPGELDDVLPFFFSLLYQLLLMMTSSGLRRIFQRQVSLMTCCLSGARVNAGKKRLSKKSSATFGNTAPMISQHLRAMSMRTLSTSSSSSAAATTSRDAPWPSAAPFPVMHGWMLKGSGVHMSWQRRYFFLNRSGRLMVSTSPDPFKASESLSPKGSMASLRSLSPAGGQPANSSSTPRRSVSFASPLTLSSPYPSSSHIIKWEICIRVEDIVRVEDDHNSGGAKLPPDHNLANCFHCDVAVHQGPSLTDVTLRRLRFCCFSRKDRNGWIAGLRRARQAVMELERQGIVEPSPLTKLLCASRPELLGDVVASEGSTSSEED